MNDQNMVYREAGLKFNFTDNCIITSYAIGTFHVNWRIDLFVSCNVLVIVNRIELLRDLIGQAKSMA